MIEILGILAFGIFRKIAKRNSGSINHDTMTTNPENLERSIDMLACPMLDGTHS